MTIATLNIDWARKYKSKHHFTKIEAALEQLDADFLVLTECIALNLPSYNYIYKTTTIPLDGKYEGFDYGKYLKRIPANRVSIYSKQPAVRTFEVNDHYTSIAKEFTTGLGRVTLYGTIIGTQFSKKPYAEKELVNCINDSIQISDMSEFFCLCGDLNTSFFEGDEDFQIRGIKSRLKLLELCKTCDLALTTNRKMNIDHILVSRKMADITNCSTSVFVERNILSDHEGIVLHVDEYFS